MSCECCPYCLMYSYISYISCFFCLVFKDLTEEWYKNWKNKNVNTRGFNNYEIIPKIDENIISTRQTDTSYENEITSEENITINLNESISTILKKWTIRPNISESINERYPI